MVTHTPQRMSPAELREACTCAAASAVVSYVRPLGPAKPGKTRDSGRPPYGRASAVSRPASGQSPEMSRSVPA